MKLVANDIFGAFERFKRGECTYDRALEDASNIMNKYADERPIVGYLKTGELKEIFSNILHSRKQNQDKTYLFDVKIHRNDVENMQRIFNSLNNQNNE